MKTKPTINNMDGFTLVELMVVVLLTAIAVMAIYRGYTAFSHSADAQEQIIEMQQNLRIGMYWLEKGLRRAEMNEENDENAGFILNKDELTHDPPDPRLSPGPSYVSFTMDLGGTDPTVADETWAPGDPGDGDLMDDDEWITYKLEAAPLPSPVPPAPWTNFFNLVRTDENNGGDIANGVPDDPQDETIIANVDALDFVYLDESRSPLPFAGDVLATDDLKDIRAVQVCLVVRTTNEDYRYTNSESYENINPDGAEIIYTAPGDNFRRRVFCKEIKIRNAGL